MDIAASTARHAAQGRGAATIRRLWWFGALFAVPAALAGLALLWVDPREPAAVTAGGQPGAVPAAPVPAPASIDVPVDAPAPAPQELLRARLAAELAARPIRFAADSAELTTAAAATVQEVAGLLVAAPPVPVSVEGHVADTPGEPELARLLSGERAAAVAEALVAAGVPADRVSVRGRGAELPLRTVEESRRVEITAG